ncbi:amidohydrolase family protein [Steroidobacter sp.]|uniref:amidohydrolase family protein n=1 Tax=Steroidobacter sp. TaxID=1978227 RepID=UPI001A508081|nr:amidohydrolase family protein [Steroidobacter sp.]MBL8272005.1 amidohydrolase family protein [Steroidobacter sp.]
MTKRCGALLLLLLAYGVGFAEPAPSSWAITNVRVVDTRTGTVGQPVDVELAGGRISAIRPAGSSPQAMKKHDGTGRFVVPGYWDMHVHVNGNDAEKWMLPMFAVAGVTGVRDMNGDCFWASDCSESMVSMRSLQRRLESGEVLGPRLLAIASAQVVGPRGLGDDAPSWSAPGNAADARRMVHESQKRGADFIKPYTSIPREAYFELLRAASASGLRLSGHVPMSVNVVEAAEGGQLSIEHAVTPALDCSTYSDGLHERYARWAARESEEGNERGYYPKVLASFDSARCDKIISRIAKTRVWYVPTLLTRRFEARSDEKAFREDPRLRLVPTDVRTYWTDDADSQAKLFKEKPEQKRAYVDFYELGVRLTGKMHAAGVPILVGTDALDSYSFPGSGFHDEMLELRKAGLSNAAILRAATLSAAEYLGREAEFGTVEPGKAADLVILNADPVQNIENAAKIEAVVLNGRLLARAERQRIEADVARFAAKLKATAE